MALVNPQIAMSYRPTVEYQPRNALAEAAQIQQLVGGQRQAEVANMQLEDLRRERDTLGQIQAAIVAKGGPPDLEAAADAMIKTGRPEYLTQGMAIRTALRNQREAAAYRKDFGLGGAPAAASANAMTAPAPAAAPVPEGELVAAPIGRIPLPTAAPAAADAPAPAGETNLAYLQRQFGMPAGAAAGANALAPAAAPASTNAMIAAQPAAPAAAPDANVLRLRALETQYRRIGNNPELAGEKALVLKQIEDVQQTIRAESATPPEAKFMRALGLPLTTAGFAEFEALKQRPGEFERLLSQSGLPKTDQTALIRQRLRKEVSHPPGTSVTLVQEKAERGRFGELLVKQYEDISKAAGLAAKTLPALDTQAKILDQGFSTGFGTDVKKAGASVLAALGVPEAEKFATDAQTFLAATQQAVLQRQLEQKGPQTEADAQRITQTGAQLGNTVNANRFIIDVAKAQLKRDIEQRNFYNEWRRGPGNNSFDGAEDAWFSGPGGKSLFDRPELKKYLAPTQGAAAGGGAAAPAIPQAAIDALRAGRGTDAQFDAIFGAGAAKRARGQ
jgi:hypothetical protein